LIDGRRTIPAIVSVRKRESASKEYFGWLKTIALPQKVRHRFFSSLL